MLRNKNVTISAYNKFLETRKSNSSSNVSKGKSKVSFCLAKFNTKCKLNHFKDINNAPNLTNKTYNPKNSTALYDAIGLVLKKYKSDKYNDAICVILTDGQENSSKNYKKDEIFKLIKYYEDEKGWLFQYLGCDRNDYQEKGKITAVTDDFTEIQKVISSNRVHSFENSTKGFNQAYKIISSDLIVMEKYQNYKKNAYSNSSLGRKLEIQLFDEYSQMNKLSSRLGRVNTSSELTSVSTKTSKNSRKNLW